MAKTAKKLTPTATTPPDDLIGTIARWRDLHRQNDEALVLDEHADASEAFDARCCEAYALEDLIACADTKTPEEYAAQVCAIELMIAYGLDDDRLAPIAFTLGRAAGRLGIAGVPFQQFLPVFHDDRQRLEYEEAHGRWSARSLSGGEESNPWPPITDAAERVAAR